MDSTGRDPTRILFVCMGNICRSPAAENVMRDIAEKKGLSDRLEIDSAGTISLHAGNPPDDRMNAAAKRRGIAMNGQARQITAADLNAFDWILVMDQENLDEVEMLEEQCGDFTAEITLFCEFCTEHEALEVPDPYYGGSAGFEQVLDLLEDGCSEIARSIRDGEL